MARATLARSWLCTRVRMRSRFAHAWPAVLPNPACQLEAAIVRAVPAPQCQGSNHSRHVGEPVPHPNVEQIAISHAAADLCPG
eukprot:17680-Chlamydomonas_euryale.AAC.2